jgi:hypothetical protein
MCKSGQNTLRNVRLENFLIQIPETEGSCLLLDCSLELLFDIEDGNDTFPETSANIYQKIEIFKIGIYRQNSVRLSNNKIS